MRRAPMVGWVAALLLLPAATLDAQTLEQRIASVRDGAVTFQFAARPGVCGDGERFIRTGRSTHYGSFRVGGPMEPCVEGPVQVRATLEAGAVRRIQYWVGRPRARDGQDLGQVPAAEAARWLLGVAARGSPDASAKAIFPAVLADTATVWPALLTIARDDDTRSRRTRQEALVFLSRFAGAALAGRPNDPFAEDEAEPTPDEELKLHAVFVLSQLRREEAVPALMDVARTNPNRRVRSQALFWLGQSGDARALDLIESVLRS